MGNKLQMRQRFDNLNTLTSKQDVMNMKTGNKDDYHA